MYFLQVVSFMNLILLPQHFNDPLIRLATGVYEVTIQDSVVSNYIQIITDILSRWRLGAYICVNEYGVRQCTEKN